MHTLGRDIVSQFKRSVYNISQSRAILIFTERIISELGCWVSNGQRAQSRVPFQHCKILFSCRQSPEGLVGNKWLHLSLLARSICFGRLEPQPYAYITREASFGLDRLNLHPTVMRIPSRAPCSRPVCARPQ